MSEFPPQLPHGNLEEVLPDVFFVTGQMEADFGGQIFRFSRNMTVVRDGSDLTLVNTLRLDDAGLNRLDALGTVRNVVRLGAFHGRDDAFYVDRDGATMWAPAGMEHERGVRTDKVLAANGPAPSVGASAFLFETASVPEAILRLDRHDGVLISCDSLQNWTGPDEYFDEPSTAMMSSQGFFHPANVGPGWLGAAKPQAADFSRLKQVGFRHLLSSHGTPLLNDAHSQVSETFERLFEV